MPLDPKTTAAVERVRDLLASDPSLSTRAACGQVGINESTFRRRLQIEGNPAPRGVPGAQLASVHQPGRLEGADVEIPVIHRYFEGDSHSVYPLGDLHLGSRAHAGAKWREWLGWFKNNPDASVIFTGDGLNAALTTSVSDTYSETMTVKGARQQLVKDFRPLAEADQLDLLIPGNHEWRIERATGDEPIGVIAEILGMEDRYAADAAMVVYHVGDIEYEFYVIHGTRAGRRVGSRANALEDMQNVIDADVYIQAHAHTQIGFPQQRLVRRGNDIERRTRYFVGAGSFLALESYAVRGGYRPTKIGAPRIRLDGRRYDIHVSA